MHTITMGLDTQAMKRALYAVVAVPFLLVACSTFNTKVIDPLITALSKIGNTAVADLKTAGNVALAATPPDTDGANCIAGVITVAAQINAVLTAANAPTAGGLTTAELASLFQPGSAQYNAAQQVIVSACAAKAQDVLGAAGVLAAGGVVGALAGGQVLPVLAAAL
jgi:hypothetical protein